MLAGRQGHRSGAGARGGGGGLAGRRTLGPAEQGAASPGLRRVCDALLMPVCSGGWEIAKSLWAGEATRGTSPPTRQLLGKRADDAATKHGG